MHFSEEGILSLHCQLISHVIEPVITQPQKQQVRIGPRLVGLAGIRHIALLACLVWGLPLHASGLNISDHYSPRNRERAKRKSTTAIVLHTTEGPTAGSLNKLHKNGETHYLVDTRGKVYRIIHRDRVAHHCGRSMWNGRTNMDNTTVGIEVVGYHNKKINATQYAALKELVAQLQGIYRLPDERVLTHSMVAYGKPNRWHRASHRGRKRCGMLFATLPVREKLGLTRGPTYDPDVRSKRLVIGDPYLADVLYGGASKQKTAAAHFTSEGRNIISRTRSAWDIARDAHRSANTLYVFPDGSEKRGDQIRDWKAIPSGTRVVLASKLRDDAPEGVMVLGKDGDTAWDLAGKEYNAKTTIYFLPDGNVRTGDAMEKAALNSLPAGTRLLVGYVDGGKITKRKSAFDICGSRWNLASTYYALANGSLVAGSSLDERAIPKGARVFLVQ